MLTLVLISFGPPHSSASTPLRCVNEPSQFRLGSSVVSRGILGFTKAHCFAHHNNSLDCCDLRSEFSSLPIKKTPRRVFFWRKGRDLNPRYRQAVQQISSLPHSTTLPPFHRVGQKCLNSADSQSVGRLRSANHQISPSGCRPSFIFAFASITSLAAYHALRPLWGVGLNRNRVFIADFEKKCNRKAFFCVFFIRFAVSWGKQEVLNAIIYVPLLDSVL